MKNRLLYVVLAASAAFASWGGWLCEILRSWSDGS